VVLVGKRLQERIQKLIRQFGGDDTESAREEVIKIGSPAVPALIEALKDEHSYMRHNAAEALGKIGIGDEHFEIIVQNLKHDNEYVREGAACALGKLKDARYVSALIVTLKDEAADVRKNVIHALAEIKDVSAVPALIETLKDQDEKIVKRAVWALGMIGDSRAVGPVIGLLDDPEIRTAALFSLRNIGESALESVSQVYIEERLTYEEFDLFCKTLKEKVEGNFDKGTIAPPKKPPGNPDEMKRIALRRMSEKPRQKTENRNRLRGVANG
jgi:HEAT repeat protein